MSTVTSIQIINKSLLKIRRKTITSITEDSAEGRAANVLYTLERDSVLASHPWNFAIERTKPQLLSATPAFEFDYQYQLPADCLRVLYLYDSDQRFKVEGRKLLTNEGSPKVVYIKRITDTSQFSPLFVDALSTKLSAELVVALTDDDAAAEVLYSQFKDKMREAKRRDGQEGTMDTIVYDTIINSRRGIIRSKFEDI